MAIFNLLIYYFSSIVLYDTHLFPGEVFLADSQLLVLTEEAPFLFLKNTFCLLFIYWLLWVFVAGHGLSLVAAGWGYSSCSVRASLRWFLSLPSAGSKACGLR